LQLFLKICIPLLSFICTGNQLWAQLTVSGTVFDSSKRSYVENVGVKSNAGKFTQTDSMGNYKIQVSEKDSLTFIYQNKPTQKFAVKDIPNLTQFDISLPVNIKGGYHTLKEVVVFARSYQQDSMENRELYEDVFNYKKPTLRTSISPGGVPGADVDEIINMFRFKRNKHLKAFQARVEQQEQDNYVRYRFNKNFVRRITHLQGAELDTFMVRYLPTYEFASTADEVSFNRYILNSSYAFKIALLKQEEPKLPAQAKN
jgi:hypothetical protein